MWPVSSTISQSNRDAVVRLADQNRESNDGKPIHFRLVNVVVASGTVRPLTAIHYRLFNPFCPDQPAAFDVYKNVAYKKSDHKSLFRALLKSDRVR
jgi:hypothetical protein